jgi:purine-binding chemotaxis protein CheW
VIPAAPRANELRLVVFTLDDQRFALDVERVERALPMVELTPFPKAPAVVRGVFDLHGEAVPAISLRLRFRRADRALRVSDQLLLVRTPRRRVALIVDAVEPVITVPGTTSETSAMVPGLEFVRGILPLPDAGLVWIADLDSFLSLEEEARLAQALEETRE